MKIDLTCPKCGSERLVDVHEVANTSSNTGAEVKVAHLVRRADKGANWVVGNYTTSEGELSAVACRACGFVETYLKAPEKLDPKGKGTQPLEGPSPTYSDRQRIGMLELQVEALVRLLEHRVGITEEEVSLMVSRIDLEDGVEDGMRGPNQRSHAPKCSSCGHPVNPKREACVYCAAPVEVTPEEIKSGIECSLCGTKTPRRDVQFSEHGMVCPSCYSA